MRTFHEVKYSDRAMLLLPKIRCMLLMNKSALVTTKPGPDTSNLNHGNEGMAFMQHTTPLLHR